MFKLPLILAAIVLLMAQEKYAQSLSQGVEDFSLELFRRIAVGVNKDFMISPFTVWSLFVLLYEGSSGGTYYQLRQTLGINADDRTLREFSRAQNQFLNVMTNEIEIKALRGIYVAHKFSINPSYKSVLQQYSIQPLEVDFKNLGTVRRINEQISSATRGLIKNTVQQRDLSDATMFLLSTIYFKGKWKFPFSKEMTRVAPFYNENGQVIAQVPMMNQETNFPYVDLAELAGTALELPYGSLEWISMIAVLPNEKVTLNTVVNNLKKVGLQTILKRLAEYKMKNSNAMVDVSMPKFETTTDLSLNDILNQMGIRDLFDQNSANLDRIAPGLYASLCKHSSKIIVDEQGTESAGITGVSIGFKFLSPRIDLNRPFLYLIVDKQSGLLLFAGQVRNPKA
ncbi:serine protease inhibitor 77Ba-like [Drosophila subpulchrella]|uniref:serine protease inhibitor 77Ba-like n=1 Tax=Drosophila subpulchrella TaxID=1486046 RepID=UPI0018A1745C|nr:serine protease inhibitor 77Ba-like [Drosophila subpulchrella]